MAKLHLALQIFSKSAALSDQAKYFFRVEACTLKQQLIVD